MYPRLASNLLYSQELSWTPDPPVSTAQVLRYNTTTQSGTCWASNSGHSTNSSPCVSFFQFLFHLEDFLGESGHFRNYIIVSRRNRNVIIIGGREDSTPDPRARQGRSSHTTERTANILTFLAIFAIASWGTLTPWRAWWASGARWSRKTRVPWIPFQKVDIPRGARRPRCSWHREGAKNILSVKDKGDYWCLENFLGNETQWSANKGCRGPEAPENQRYQKWNAKMCVTGSKLRKVRLATVELNRPLSLLNSLEESANGSYLQPSHCSNRLHEWMEGCMDAWMNGCMGGCMDGVG